MTFVSTRYCSLVEEQQTGEQKSVIRENSCHHWLLAACFEKAEEFCCWIQDASRHHVEQLLQQREEYTAELRADPY